MEIVQDSYILAHRKFDQLKNPQAVVAWLSIIVKHRAINVLLHSRRVQCLSELDDNVPEESVYSAQLGIEDDPSAALQHAEREHAVKTLLAQLAPIDQEALRTFYLDGKSLKEMHAADNTPIGTHKRRLCIARQRARKKMETVGTAPEDIL
jgi:RNA polymerase sigma factor (sigma-70 family)